MIKKTGNKIHDQVYLALEIFKRILRDSNSKIDPAWAYQTAKKLAKINPLGDRDERTAADNFFCYAVEWLVSNHLTDNLPTKQ